ncbi:thiamine-binding protein [Thermosulfurimonas sp.]|uniref:thiamine-binding protein n=1 Tax=Thermosulfurimonas sp. TaxID=2080236 RepID=UPI0025E619E1|nr:thiamine-binding protein [Thermosulfurimonas sp.]
MKFGRAGGRDGPHGDKYSPALLHLAAELHEIPFGAGAKRVFTVIKIDDRRDREVHLGDKVQSVEERLRSEG